MVRLLAVTAALAVIASAAIAAPAQAAPACNAATAAQLEKRLPIKPYIFEGARSGQTLCFDFSGDGRKDIVFTGWRSMNHGAHYWAAFQASETGSLRVKFKRGCCRANPRNGSGIAIKRSGRRLVVTEPVYRSADPACCPSGGTKTGTWSWQGGTLALVSEQRKP